MLPATYYLTTSRSNNFSTSIFSVCLNHNYYFVNNSCQQVTSGISYCIAANNSVCTQCVYNFYLNSQAACRPCTRYSHCLTCDQYNCRQCQPQYYLAVDLTLNTIMQFYNSSSVSASASSQCLPCAVLGCLYCRNRFND